MAQEDAYETHDIYLAAYLSEAGCELKGRRKQGHRVFFSFTNVGGPITTLREDFFSGRGKVTASKYADAIKKFKELCFFE
jgi:hypothetical protein